MGDDNPYRAPSAPLTSPVRRQSRPLGPILTGIVAIVVATFLLWSFGLGTFGLIPSLLGVGSWWVYKFMPRPLAPETEGARQFLRDQEGSPAVGDIAAGTSRRTGDEQAGDLLGDLRL